MHIFRAQDHHQSPPQSSVKQHMQDPPQFPPAHTLSFHYCNIGPIDAPTTPGLGTEPAAELSLNIYSTLLARRPHRLAATLAPAGLGISDGRTLYQI